MDDLMYNCLSIYFGQPVVDFYIVLICYWPYTDSVLPIISRLSPLFIYFLVIVC